MLESIEWIPFLQIIVGTFVSEDATLIGSLVAYQKDSISIYTLMAGYVLGVTVGDLGLYGIGVLGGFLGRWKKWENTQKKPNFVIRMLLSITSKGKEYNNSPSTTKKKNTLLVLLILSRFVPGSRIPLYTYAGLTRYSILNFTGILFLTSLIYVSVFCIVIHQLDIPPDTHWGLHVVIALCVFVITMSFFKLFLFCVREKGRYKTALKIKWYQLLRYRYYEFWPAWFFYIPVVGIVSYFFIRHRSIVLPGYVNPSIKYSGIVGESKQDIENILKNNLDSHGLFSLSVHCSEELDIRLLHTQQWMQNNNVLYPIIAKPDQGLRGLGVQLIHSQQELNYYIREQKEDVLLQEYCSWMKEVGILYYRYPQQDKGHIFSITKKVFPYIIGDGKHTIEELVLQDSRARYIVDTYKAQFEQETQSGTKENLWNKVLPIGEKSYLTQYGNHCRGTIFLDGSPELLTPELAEKIDHLAHQIPGFYFGRFDIRYQSEEQLRLGEQFKVIELNGAGAEATHIYDPKVGIWRAYKTLFKQWFLIYHIGIENKKRGVSRDRFRGFLKELWKSFLSFR